MNCCFWDCRADGNVVIASRPRALASCPRIRVRVVATCRLPADVWTLESRLTSALSDAIWALKLWPATLPLAAVVPDCDVTAPWPLVPFADAFPPHAAVTGTRARTATEAAAMVRV